MTLNNIYILDVSGYIFRSYYALPRMTNSEGHSTHALFGFIRSILKILKDFDPQYIVAVFDGEDNKRSRTEIFAEYKAHRQSMPEDLPLQMQWAHDVCDMLGIAKLSVEGVEADDTMGSVATWAAEQKAKVFLCTSDKDMCQLVNEHINVLHTHKDNLIVNNSKVKELYGVEPDQIIDLLSLTGDASDNIPGVSGIGPKTASQLLQEFGTLENLLANTAHVKGAKRQEVLMREKDTALFSKRLATIDTAVDFPRDIHFFERKEIKKDELLAFYKKMNFTSLIKEFVQANQEKTHVEDFEDGNYLCVDDVNSLNALIEELMNSKEIAFDTETTALSPFTADVVGIGFCSQIGKAYYVPLNGQLGHDYVLNKLKPVFADSKLAFFGHHVKYDLHTLMNHDVPIATINFDTMLASYLLHSHSHRHSLDNLSQHYLGKTKGSIEELLGKGRKERTMAEVPILDVAPYCCRDADLTYHLKTILEKEIHERKLDKLFYELELPLLRVLEQMERTGIYVDKDYLKKLSKEFSEVTSRLQNDIYELAQEEFNISSPKQLSSILFEKLGIKSGRKTATGHYSTNADVLENLRHHHPIIEKILEFRTLEKLRTTYVESLPSQINPQTGRIHCTFNQFVAATGRLSCQDPNLQNIPIRTEEGRKIREAFQPQNPGWNFLSADYSQIELRLLAHLSQDPELIKAFLHGEDIHAYTASQVFNVPLENVTKDQRRASKAVNFGIIYGQQAFGLAQELKISVKEAASFIESYFLRYPKVRQFIESCKEQARISGKAVTMTGRERHIPDILSKNAVIRTQAERLSVNTPLQGTAADLIKLAMLEVDKRMKKEGKKSLMILQIHDELLFEVPDNELVEMKNLIKESMENVFNLSVPLLIEISIGKNWKEC